MKKLLVGILLLAVLSAVIYLQTRRESTHKSAAFREGYRTGADSVRAGRPDYDSLTELLAQERQALADYKATMADSLTRLDTTYKQRLDSVSRVKDSQRTESQRPGETTLTTASPPLTGKKAKAPSSSGVSHQEILDHYRLAMAKLPSDLSAYEYQVAVTEVRTETASRYSITVDRLNQIRKEHNLDF